MHSFPFLFLSFTATQAGFDFAGADTTIILAGAGVALYGLRKLDVLSEMLSYLLGILVVCVVIILHPDFAATDAAEYARETLGLMVELLRAFIDIIKNWGGVAAAVVGVINV